MTLQSDWDETLSLVQQIQTNLYSAGVPGVLGPSLVGGGSVEGGDGRCILYTRWRMPDGETYTGSIKGPCRTMRSYVSAAKARLAQIAAANPHDIASRLGAGFTAATSGFDFVGDAQRAEDESNLHKHDFTIRRSRDGGWSGCVTIPTRAGSISICASADERAISRALRDSMAQSGYVGDVFGDIAHGFDDMSRGIAEGRVFDRLGSAVHEAMHNPLVSTILDVASVIPGVGIGVTAMRTAGTVVDQLQRGDPQTAQHVQQVLSSAQQGDPHAQRATAAIAAAAGQRGAGHALTTLTTLFSASQRQGGIQSRDIQNAGTALLSDLGSLIHGPGAASSGYEPWTARASGFRRRGYAPFRGASPEVGVGWDWYHRPARPQTELFSARQTYLQGEEALARAPVHDIRSLDQLRAALGI